MTDITKPSIHSIRKILVPHANSTLDYTIQKGRKYSNNITGSLDIDGKILCYTSTPSRSHTA